MYDELKQAVGIRTDGHFDSLFNPLKKECLTQFKNYRNRQVCEVRDRYAQRVCQLPERPEWRDMDAARAFASKQDHARTYKVWWENHRGMPLFSFTIRRAPSFTNMQPVCTADPLTGEPAYHRSADGTIPFGNDALLRTVARFFSRTGIPHDTDRFYDPRGKIAIRMDHLALCFLSVKLSHNVDFCFSILIRRVPMCHADKHDAEGQPRLFNSQRLEAKQE